MTMPTQCMNLHELSHLIFTWALRGPCQLIKGWWQLHPSPYVFFHSETSPVGTFPSSVKPHNISNSKDHQWARSWYEIFRTTRWHDLDLPGKVMWCYHSNREHHRYVKKVVRRGTEGVSGCLNRIRGCGISVGGCGCMLNIKTFAPNDAWVAVPLFITPLWCSITINIC